MFNLEKIKINLDTFILEGQINNFELINNLKKEIIQLSNQHSQYNYKTNVKGNFTGFKSLVTSTNFHFFLNSISKEINQICTKDINIVDAWGNICNIGDEVLIHNHRGFTAFSGILYLTENGPGTYFPEYDKKIIEKIGKFVLFHPMLNHEVKKINVDGRITLAFNVNEVCDWDLDKIKKEGVWINAI